jgi:hypothetical protein
MSLKVLYRKNWYLIDMPDDPKFFKLTRAYYPDTKFKVGKKMVKIKDLKSCYEERLGVFNKHHLKARSRGGQSIESNLLTMDISRHNAWHLLFGNLTIYEIVKLLLKVRRIKKRQEISFLQTG